VVIETKKQESAPGEGKMEWGLQRLHCSGGIQNFRGMPQEVKVIKRKMP